jgi:hypothetical protein
MKPGADEVEMTVHLRDVVAEFDPAPTDDGRTTKTISGTPEMTIADIGTMFRMMCYSIDFERYYRVRDINCQEGTVPFIISNGHVRWLPSVHSVSIADFFSTHNIESNEIYIRHGWPAAGGIGWLDIPTLWEDVYRVLLYASPLIAAGQITVPALRRLVSRLHEKASPGSVFSLVASRHRWTAIDLAELTNLPQDESKRLLVMCGYKYDKHCRMYCQTPEAEALILELNKQRWTIKPGRPPQA